MRMTIVMSTTADWVVECHSKFMKCIKQPNR